MRLLKNFKFISLLFSNFIILCMLSQQQAMGTSGFDSSVKYKRIGACGRDHKGIRVEASNRVEHLCYYIVNSGTRIGNSMENIDISSMAVVAENPAVTQKGIAGVSIRDLNLLGKIQPGTLVTVIYHPMRHIRGDVNTRFFISNSSGFGLVGVSVDSSGKAILNHDKNSTATEMRLTSPVSNLGTTSHQISILFMNHYCKVYLDKTYLGDYPYMIQLNDIKNASAWGNLRPKVILQGHIANTVKNAMEADSFCRKHYSGHLIVYENENEKTLLDEILGLKSVTHSLYEVFGVAVSQVGNLDSFDGTNVGYISQQLGDNAKYLRTGKCVARLRLFNFTGKWEIIDRVEVLNCSDPVPSFICRSRVSREYGSSIMKFASDNNSGSNYMFPLGTVGFGLLLIVSALGTWSILMNKHSLQPNKASEITQLYDNTAPATFENVSNNDNEKAVVHYVATDLSSQAVTVHDDYNLNNF